MRLRLGPSGNLSKIKNIARSEQPKAGIKNLDRGLIIFIWTMAVFYGMMCEQMVGRTPAQSCEVRQPLDDIYGIVSLSFVLITPASLGPLSVAVIYVVIRLVKRNLTTTGIREWENIKCTASLTLIFLLLYSNTMILCELWDFPQDNMFALVLSMTKLSTPTIIHFIKYFQSNMFSAVHPIFSFLLRFFSQNLMFGKWQKRLLRLGWKRGFLQFNFRFIRQEAPLRGENLRWLQNKYRKSLDLKFHNKYPASL